MQQSVPGSWCKCRSVEYQLHVKLAKTDSFFFILLQKVVVKGQKTHILSMKPVQLIQDLDNVAYSLETQQLILKY